MKSALSLSSYSVPLSWAIDAMSCTWVWRPFYVKPKEGRRGHLITLSIVPIRGFGSCCLNSMDSRGGLALLSLLSPLLMGTHPFRLEIEAEVASRSKLLICPSYRWYWLWGFDTEIQNKAISEFGFFLTRSCSRNPFSSIFQFSIPWVYITHP